MTVLDWGYRANIKVHQAGDDHSANLKLKDNNGTVKFSQFIKQDLKFLDPSKKLYLNPYLFNGSLQTLYYTSMDSSNKFMIYYGRELFTYKDNGICSLDWVIPKPKNPEQFKRLQKETMPEGFPRLHPRCRYFDKEELSQLHEENLENTKPVVAILHGLAGGSHESLIRNFAEQINKNTKDWDVVVINSRGCARTKITNGKLFTAGSTDDIREVLQTFKQRWPKRPIYLVGFSFGAALTSNFLAEEGEKENPTNLVKAACTICCPWDFVDGAHHLQESWTGKYLLSPALAKFLTKLVTNNYKELNKYIPDIINENTLKTIENSKSLWEFDDNVTCKTTPYNSAFEYYKELSPVNKIDHIKTPLLALNSTDDPAVGVKLPILQMKSNPYFCLVETDLGGHLGYIQQNGEFWCVELAEQFFQKFEELIE
ncbi:MAG: alpha/beta fold hydrolase [Asgard group archaeon]|nr:alpha/beta fold hydrolase [Asgard group archaeon]